MTARKGNPGKVLETWLKGALNDKSSRTASISCKGERLFIRISHYFEHYNDGLDARGEGNSLIEASYDAILHFNQLLWKQIVRRSKDPNLNKLKYENHDLILKEMKKVQEREFSINEWIKTPENREKIYKNYDILELNRKEEDK